MATAKSRRIMGKDKFESHIKSVFDHHEVSIDTNEIWDGIEQSLPSKSSPSMWIWLTGLAILLVAGLSLFYLGAEDSSSKADEQNMVSSADPSHNNDGGQSQSELSVLPESDREKVSSSREDSDETDSGFIQKESSSNQKSPIADGSSITQNGDFSMTTQSSSNAYTPSTFKEKNLELQSDPGVTTTSNIHPNKQDVVRDEEPYFEILTSEQQIVIPEQIRNTRSEAQHTLATTASTLSRAKSGERAQFSALSLLRHDLDDSALDQTSIPGISTPTLNDCYDFSLRSWLWTMDTYVGFNYAAKSLTRKDNANAGEDYISNRKSTEDYLEAFEAGMSFSAINRKGFLVSAGVNYSQIDEKFNYFQVKTENRFDSVVVRIEIDSAGMADTIREWRQVTVQTASEILTYNYYRMVDIPLAVGYQFHRGKWTFEVQGGVMFNLLFNKKGEILDSSNNIIEFTDNDLVFKDRIGLSAFGGVKAIYPVNDRIGLYLEPHARFNLKSITSEAYPLEQRYNQFGLRAGARWIF